jgi:hypothetical protein
MQQRQLRLGDILDDYCPRERRITNHAVVAMIDQEVKQTRCTTCEAEHDYRHARIPPQRKKKEPAGALYQEVLAGAPRPRPALAPGDMDGSEEAGAAAGSTADPGIPPAASPEAPSPEEPLVREDEADESREEGPVHRQLIRATLPRPEGQAPTRPAPEFTMRQPTGRPGRFRDGNRAVHPRSGNRAGAGGSFRFDGRHQDRQFHGNRSGNHAPGRHSGGSGRPGKKRSR